MQFVDLATAKVLARTAAYANPDKFATCVYVARQDENSENYFPECLVGVVLHGLGIDIRPLNDKGRFACGVLSLPYDYLRRVETSQFHTVQNVVFTIEAVSFLDRLQNLQDSGVKWAKAFETADSEF